MFRTMAGLLFLTLVSCAPAVPPILREDFAATPAGTVTIVFFTDFQCPFCRRTHAALASVLADERANPDGATKVRIVLRHVPLRMHPDARNAARAAICGEVLGAREDLVDALYAEASDLGEASVARLVIDRGIDRDAYAACLKDPRTDARIVRDTSMLDALEGDGVPILYVGRTRLDGAQTRGALKRALDAAAREARRDRR